MTSFHSLTIVAIATAIVSVAAVARPLQAAPEQTHARADHGDRAHPTLLPVVTGSLPDQPAYGWQYFTDPRAAHAVVISPRGEYFASFGRGLRQITGPTGQVSVQQPTNN